MKIYNLEVNIIPTNKPVTRKDINDKIYKSEEAKFKAIVKEIKNKNEKGQPVLIGTISIEKNELLSELLKREGISHNVLNAKQHAKEAEIIAQAGRAGAVTVATNMAGRGVDIILGGTPYNKEEYKKVVDAGGLYVLGTERHESRRIDNQLRGRSGRQGDPGLSCFFVSMDDDLMRVFGSDRMKSIMNTLKIPDDMPIENGMISKSIEKSQMRVEGYNFDMRKHLVEYDDVMNKQRETIYKKRKSILTLSEGEKFENYNTLSDYVVEIIENEITDIVSFHTASDHGTVWNINEIFESIKTIYPLSDEEIKNFNELMEKENKDEKLAEAQKRTNIIEYFSNLAKIKYEELKNKILTIEGLENAKNPIAEIEKGILLRSIDSLWIEHLDNIDHLRAGIGLRGYAQTDPLVEYKRETYELFVELLNNIEKQVVYSIYKVIPAINVVSQNKNISVITNDPTENRQFGLAKSMAEEAASNRESHNTTTLKNDEVKKYGAKIGRNDDCPCGAKKEDGTPIKYKNCCGKNE